MPRTKRMPYGTWDKFNEEYLKPFRESRVGRGIQSFENFLKPLTEPIPELINLTEKLTPGWLEPKEGSLASALGPLNPRFVAKNFAPADLMLGGAGKVGMVEEALSGIPKIKKMSDMEKQLKASVELAKGMKQSGIEKPQVAINELKRTLGGMPSRAEEAANSKKAYEASLKPTTKMVNELKRESALDRAIREASESVSHIPEEVRNLPPVKKGYVRVFRGEGKTQVKGGPWVTTDPGEAKSYFEGAGKLRHWDIPESALEEINENLGRDISLRGEFNLGPKEWNIIEKHALGTTPSGKPFPSGHLSTSRGERGSLGKAIPPPKITLPGRFRLVGKINGKNINFASDFDKAAYQLSRGKKVNVDLLEELKTQTGLSDNVILRHSRKLAARINSLDKITKPGQDIQLYKRLIQKGKSKVKEDSRVKKAAETAIGLASELKFGGDLPLGRQSFRPFLLHPIKTGLPALKTSLKSMTEEGFKKEMAALGETPTGKVLDALKTVGEGNLAKLLPNVGELKKLPVSDLEQFFSKSSLGEKIPGLGRFYVKPSKRMYEAGQFRTRINELERILGGEEGLFEYLKNPDKAGDLASAIKRVGEETGYGRLPGVLDRALEAASYGFTAPRNVVAKTQFYNPLSYVPKTKYTPFGRFGSKNKSFLEGFTDNPVYKDFMIDQAKWLGGLGALGYGSKQMGADVEPNPFASNFGIRYGNYKPDIMGGEAGIVKTIPRIWPKEDETRINAQGKEYPGDPSEDLRRFVRGRVRPGLPAMAFDVFQGYNPDVGMRTNYLGENLRGDIFTGEGKQRTLEEEADIPYGRWIAEQFTPSWPEDIYDTIQKEPAATPASILLGGLGFGSTTYDPFESNPYKPPKQFYRLPVKGRPKRQRQGSSKWIGDTIQ